MNEGFFKGRRLEVYCKGGQLSMDRKTQKRSWKLKLALTLEDDDAAAAGGAILSNYRQIRARSNAVERIEIAGAFVLIAQFFGDRLPNSKLLLRLDKCYVDEMAMSCEDEITELWLRLEHENTDKLHAFVKDYAFTRFTVAFSTQQKTIAEAIEESAAASSDRVEEIVGQAHPITAGAKLKEFKPRGKVN